ncbi:MAG: glycine--tRNA ligase [Candidatus Sumerlaeaceae bacterium]|nr:glycine--tRNA ligase [Candidatus Sumerlaeaceae bacterium]
MAVTMDAIVSLCKRRGLIFQSSEIYGGLASTWDYGPIGVELKRNVKDAWWRAMVYERDDIEGLDAAILMHPQAWVASGHVANFSDPLVDCKSCKRRFRQDHLPNYIGVRLRSAEMPTDVGLTVTIAADSFDDAMKKIKQGKEWSSKPKGYWTADQLEPEHVVKVCPECGGELTEPRQFNLMFKTHLGPVEDSGSVVYMRPETAQGIFVNFESVMTTMRRKLPFGIAQVGKSFRNEITPGNFIFRTREFEQMELEFFCKPGDKCQPGERDDMQWWEHWKEERTNWYTRYGIRRENLRLREHAPDELAHYAKGCVDVEYNFPIGWQELEGIANRTSYDLTQHMEHSKKDLRYFDQERKEHYVPYVIEPSAGADRGTLAFLCDAYREEEVEGKEPRKVLKFHYSLAPIKCAVFPLLKNRPELVEKARKLAHDLKQSFYTVYDDTAAIGKLYRRQDEIGTPFCVTVDVDTMTDGQVTLRNRDSMSQDRIPLEKVESVVQEQLTAARR